VTIDEPGNVTGLHRKRTPVPSSATIGVGEVGGTNPATENWLPNEGIAEENLAEVRAGVMNATMTNVAIRAPQPRFT
jgi:hypothetical protein